MQENRVLVPFEEMAAMLLPTLEENLYMELIVSFFLLFSG